MGRIARPSLPSSGTRLVLAFIVFALVVFAVLRTYGNRSLSHREADSPAVAARKAVQADNTVVGLIGAIEGFEVVSDALGDPPGHARVAARVLGARDSGRLVADLTLEGGRWKVDGATFRLTDGTAIPVAGSAGR
jgi:hypothetical protein